MHHFCRTEQKFQYQIIDTLSQADQSWLMANDSRKYAHVSYILGSDKRYSMLKVLEAGLPQLYFLLEKQNLKFSEFTGENLFCFLGKISAKLWKHHSLSLGLAGYSVLYDHDFCFTKMGLSHEQKLCMMAEGLEYAAEKLNLNVVSLPLQPSEKAHIGCLEALEFEQPLEDFTMQLPLDGQWNSFDDYQNELKKKYKKRAQDIRKHGENLVWRSLSLPEIKQEQQKIHALYLNVLKSQKFVAGIAPERHFEYLKEIYADNFDLVAIYANDNMVGFYSYFKTENNLGVHYIGIDYLYNDSHDIYFNILFKIVELGISQKVKSIDFGRSSLDAKASLGAVPQHKSSYIKTFGLTKIIKNLLVKQLRSFETNSWRVRKPFKEEPSLQQV